MDSAKALEEEEQMASEKIPGWEINKHKNIAAEELRDSIVNMPKDLEWKPHPANERVSLAFVVSKKDDNVDGTCLFAKVPKGEGLPEHTHDVNDIIVPLSGKGKSVEDVVVFSEGKVSTKGLISEGFVPTNYSLNIKDDGKLIWETMQTQGEEMVFFKGEVTPELDKMSGVVSFQKLEGPQNYSFSSSEKREISLDEISVE